MYLDTGRSYEGAISIANKLKILNTGRALANLSGNTAVKSCTVVMLALLGVFALLSPSDAGAASATIQATVEIRTPLKITCSSELFFGKVRPGRTEGTVVVTPHKTRFTTGGARTRGGSFFPAVFVVSGQPSVFYHINMVAGPAIIDNHHHHNKCDCDSEDDHGDDDGDDDDDCDGDDDDGDDGDDDDDEDDDGDKKHRSNSNGGRHRNSNRHHNQQTNILSSLQVVDLLSFSTTAGAVTTTGQIGLNGIDRVFVGGTLIVPTTAEKGSYICEVELTVNY